LSKLQLAVALGVALLFASAAHAIAPPAFATQIQLAIIENYAAPPAVENYSYSALTDPAVAGLTTFSRSHPMAIGTLVGDLLYGAGTVHALSGGASAESSAAVQEPWVEGGGNARASADVSIIESFQIDGATASVATVRFNVRFYANGSMVPDASQRTSSFVTLVVLSPDSGPISQEIAGGTLCVGTYTDERCGTTFFEGDARNETTPAIGEFILDTGFVLEATVPTGTPLFLAFQVSSDSRCGSTWSPECASSSYASGNVDLLSVSDGTLVTQHGWLVPEPATELEAAAALGTLTLCARRRA
jgi:hypothetical protein